LSHRGPPDPCRSHLLMCGRSATRRAEGANTLVSAIRRMSLLKMSHESCQHACDFRRSPLDLVMPLIVCISQPSRVVDAVEVSGLPNRDPIRRGQPPTTCSRPSTPDTPGRSPRSRKFCGAGARAPGILRPAIRHRAGGARDAGPHVRKCGHPLERIPNERPADQQSAHLQAATAIGMSASISVRSNAGLAPHCTISHTGAGRANPARSAARPMPGAQVLVKDMRREVMCIQLAVCVLL
jgi:hypothetical protein